MPVPSTVSDGVFTIPQQNGPDKYRLPFLDKGDSRSFEIIRKMRVAADSFTAPKLMSKIRWDGKYAYLVEMTDPQIVEPDLLEYELTYACVPFTRNEGTSTTFTIQYPSFGASYDWSTPPPEPTITEIPLPMTGRAVYEYFIGAPPTLLAPKIAFVNGTRVQYGGWNQAMFVPGAQILADDSDVTIYKGNIYQRRSVYITWPTFSRF